MRILILDLNFFIYFTLLLLKNRLMDYVKSIYYKNPITIPFKNALTNGMDYNKKQSIKGKIHLSKKFKIL